MSRSPRSPRRWPALLLALVLLAAALLLPGGGVALAGPVDWQEVAATEEGRQWWDAGSLRRSRDDHLSVLSRFQPAAAEAPGAGLYVMEIDCAQRLYRDTSVNGIPRWRAEWHPAGEEDLTAEVLDAVCAAGASLSGAAAR
jgi:hypothetical protein